MQSQLNNYSQRGVTLIEAAVAILVFSVGILGMSQIQSYTHAQILDQKQRNTAIWKAQELIERIKANNATADITSYINAISDSALCDNEPIVRCSERYADGGSLAAQTCSTTQLALYDSWEVICSGNESIANRLSNYTVNLACTVTPGSVCAAQEDLVLTVVWDSNLAVTDSRLSGQTILVASETATDDASRNLVINANDNYFRQVFRP